jgi:hypothetical protein
MSPEQQQVALKTIAERLGVDLESLLNDPAFRHEIGAEELEAVEKATRDESDQP